MKHPVASLLLLASLLCLTAQAEKPSHVVKARRGSYFNEPALARSNDASVALALDQNADKDKLGGVAGVAGAAGAAGSSTSAKDPSSGRLFLKKFLMFKNMFSSNNQPVIPIIITGAGTGTSPTTTLTTTGTIPTATGTIETSPTSPTTPTSPTSPTPRNYYDAQADDQAEADAADDDEAQPAAGGIAMAANAELIDEQALQAAIAAGAQEYEVFTNEDQSDQSGATESKAQNNRINLRRKGGRRGQGQMISVRIPPRYRRYFKNGQKVMLNTKNRPNKRRVIRKRYRNKNTRLNNRRRGGKNKNKKGKNKNKRPRLPLA